MLTTDSIASDKRISQIDTTGYTTDFLLREIQILKEKMNQYQGEKIKMLNLIEIEKEKHQHTNAVLNEKIKLVEQKLKQETDKTDEMIKTIQKEKETIEANGALYLNAFNYMAFALHNKPYPGVENYTKFASARLRMLPLANVQQLKPEFGRVINDVISFRYRHSIPPCKDVDANRSIFIPVISAPGNFDKRNMIRQTWRKHLNSSLWNQEDLMGLAGFAFIIGLTDDSAVQSKIDEESQTCGDIIQIEMSDFYRNLTTKLAGLFNWLYKNCTKVDFVFKVDDDVYVNVRNLVHLVQSFHPSNQRIFGSPSFFSPNRGK